MIRILTAAAVAALLAGPAMAQSAGSDTGSPSTQQRSLDQGSGSSLSTPPSAAVPTDCTPNDVRPECQTAQLPGQTTLPPQSPGSSGSTEKSADPYADPYSSSPPSTSGGSSGSSGSSGSGQ